MPLELSAKILLLQSTSIRRILVLNSSRPNGSIYDISGQPKAASYQKIVSQKPKWIQQRQEWTKVAFSRAMAQTKIVSMRNRTWLALRNACHEHPSHHKATLDCTSTNSKQISVFDVPQQMACIASLWISILQSICWRIFCYLPQSPPEIAQLLHRCNSIG